jgi:hypothetical protein
MCTCLLDLSEGTYASVPNRLHFSTGYTSPYLYLISVDDVQAMRIIKRVTLGYFTYICHPKRPSDDDDLKGKPTLNHTRNLFLLLLT